MKSIGIIAAIIVGVTMAGCMKTTGQTRGSLDGYPHSGYKATAVPEVHSGG